MQEDAEDKVKAFTDVNIVINDDALHMYRKIPGYKTSLGKTLMRPGTHEYRPWDNFVALYKQRAGRLAYKVGEVGIIMLYTDSGLPYDAMRVVCGSTKVDMSFTRQEITNDPAGCLNKALIKLHETKTK
jgi:hypothetical protein